MVSLIMCVLPIRMMLLLAILTLGLVITAALPEIIEPGPKSGIVLKEQAGLLITNCRLHTQKVFVRLNPREVCRRHVPTTSELTGWAGQRWYREVLEHAEADTTHMLQQLQKFTITQSELSGFKHRPKRFIAGLLTAAAVVGTIFNLGLSTVNAVSLSTVKRHVNELQDEIPEIREQVYRQQEELRTIGQSVKGTILVVNSHSVALNKTIRAVNSLLAIVSIDYAHTQLVSMLMNDMLRDIGSSVDSLAMGKIPPYLIPLSLVQDILSTATRDVATPIQAHLAYTLGSAVPIFVDPEEREVGFIINLPIINSENIYRLKDVVNVGSWQGDVHVKVQTPSLVAYHDNNPDLYLAPNTRMCTLTKDIHYLCPSKPFIRDNTDGICGLKAMSADSRCPTRVTPRSQVNQTQVEIVGGRWLVNTPVRTAVLTYDQHDTATRITLPDETLWISVPENAILHIDDLALYYLDPNQYEGEIEVSEFFDQHPLELDPNTLTQIQYEGTRTINLTPVNNVLKEIAAQGNKPLQPIHYAWSTPDTVLAIVAALGYLFTFGTAFFYLRRTRALQCKLNKCTNGLSRIARLGRPAPNYPGTGLEIPDDESESSGRYTSMAPALLEVVTDSVVF